jgi:hypothetical protein
MIYMIYLTVGRFWRTAILALVASVTFLQPVKKLMAQVPVKHTQGVLHGFLVQSTLTGESLADGDLIQIARGNQVTSQLVSKLRDGSVHDETAVFSQRGNFRLLKYQLVQKGKTFQHPAPVLGHGLSLAGIPSVVGGQLCLRWPAQAEHASDDPIEAPNEHNHKCQLSDVTSEFKKLSADLDLHKGESPWIVRKSEFVLGGRRDTTKFYSLAVIRPERQLM